MLPYFVIVPTIAEMRDDLSESEILSKSDRLDVILSERTAFLTTSCSETDASP